MGGSIQREMSGKVTHLVANRCIGDKYQYAVTFRVPVVSVNWIHRAWEERDNPKCLNSNDPTVVQQYKLKPFHGARICLYGFPENEKKDMEAVLVENSGTLVDIDDSSCTHVVRLSGETKLCCCLFLFLSRLLTRAPLLTQILSKFIATLSEPSGSGYLCKRRAVQMRQSTF
jgi:twin BRCT domain